MPRSYEQSATGPTGPSGMPAGWKPSGVRGPAGPTDTSRASSSGAMPTGWKPSGASVAPAAADALPARETLSPVPKRSVGGAVKAALLGAANRVSENALPMLVGGVQALGGGLDRGGAYRRGVEGVQQASFEAERDNPEAYNLVGKPLGVAAQFAPIGGAVAAGWRGLAKAGAAGGSLFGGLAGLGATNADDTPAEILGSTAKGAAIGSTAGALLAPAMGPLGNAASEVGSDIANVARKGMGRPSVPGPWDAITRGFNQIKDNAVKRGTDILHGIKGRNSLSPELQAITPALAHVGPQEVGRVWWPGTDKNPRLLTEMEQGMERLYQFRRGAGDRMTAATLATDAAGVPYSPRIDMNNPTGQAVIDYMAREAGRSPAVMNALLEAANTAATTGSSNELGRTLLSRPVREYTRALAKDPNSHVAIPRALEEVIREAPWTMEAVNEVRKSVGNVAARGMQPGSSNTTVANKLSEFTNGLMDVFGNYTGGGQELRKAILDYKQGGDVMNVLMRYTGANQVTDAGGNRVWQIVANSGAPGPVSTTSARFIGDVLLPTGGPNVVSSAGLAAGSISVLREVPQYFRSQASGEGAKMLLQSGQAGTDLLQAVSGDAPRRATSAAARAVRAGALVAPEMLAGPPPEQRGVPAALAGTRPQELTEEEKARLPIYDPRRFR